MNSLAPNPPRPWYREPWPWIIMSGPAIVVVAGIATTVIAFTGADGLVADDYYKQGLGINRTLGRETRAAALGLEGDITFPPGRVHAQLRAIAPLPDRMQLTLSHPTRAGEDRTVFLAREAAGGWSAPLPPIAAGRWRLILEGPDWRASALADTREAASVRLRP